MSSDNSTNVIGPEEEDEDDFAPKKQGYYLKKEQPAIFKSESESMHKLIKELNEQALGYLYESQMQNISSESGQNEYLVIQRKLSEMKGNALERKHAD